MTGTVVDASAVLAFVQGETGSDTVDEALVAGARCGAANWSEVAQKVRAVGGDWPLHRAILGTLGIDVEPVTEADAEIAAELWRAGGGLSLADRLCLALGRRLDEPVITADQAWAGLPGVRLIR